MRNISLWPLPTLRDPTADGKLAALHPELQSHPASFDRLRMRHFSSWPLASMANATFLILSPSKDATSSIQLPPRQQRPEAVGAARCGEAAQFDRPVALDAELVAPRPQAPRQMMQAVLVGEADGAVHLVGDLRHLAGGLAAARFGDGDGEDEIAVAGHRLDRGVRDHA